MAKLPAPRGGEPVKVKSRPLAFSYWPMYKSTRRYGLQANVYATNPWTLIRASIRERCPAAAQAEALASVQQAEFLFASAHDTEELAAKPLLLYYSFLNAAKAFALTTAIRPTFDQAHHGIGEKLKPGGRELLDAYLEVFPSPGTRGPNLFADFLAAVTNSTVTLKAKSSFDLPALLPQIVAGHRLWCDAADKRERFIGLHEIQIRQDAGLKTIWLELRVFADELPRLNITHKQLLEEARLSASFREVTSCVEPSTQRTLLRFEQKTPATYGHRAADHIPGLVATPRYNLWATVTTAPPYRRYYLYLAPAAEHSRVLPQLLSIYAIIYYLSSITRYRPQHFNSIITGRYGEQLQELLASQPNQFLYLLASEYARREVTRAAIV